MNDELHCNGCSREFPAEALYICGLDHSARLDGPHAYALCVSCLDAHSFAWGLLANDTAHGRTEVIQ
jgi:hypothetical protein